jgi:flagellar biosynthesis protein FlhF
MIRKFKGSSFTEVFLRIKEEMGPDAVILQQQEIKNPPSPSEKVEVTVTLDDISELPPSALQPSISLPSDIEEETKKVEAYNSKGARPIELRQKPVASPVMSPDMLGKLMEVTESMGSVLAEVKGLREDFFATRTDFLEGVRVVRERVPREFAPIAAELAKTGIPAQIIQDLLAEALILCASSKEETFIKAQMKNVIANRVSVASRPRLRKGRPLVQMFIGPAGSGKSGVISKLAGRATVTGNPNIAIVTTDCYRMGAVEQMEAFAAAAEIEMGVLSSPEDAPEVFGKLREKSLVLVDTAGRSLGNAEHEKEILAFYEAIRPDEVHLVLPLNMRDRDLEKAVEAYMALKANRIVFTKQDESSELGAFVWLPVKFGVPVSYVSNGQGPDNIVSAEKDIIASWILK